jgi:ankyrin repeat protein
MKTLVLVFCLLISTSAYAALADANVTERDSDGQTALHKAAVYDWGSLDDVKKLIARGADVHAVDKDGFTPLHLAAMSGYADKAKALLGSGARYDATTKMGTLPLHLAAERRRINTELLDLLIGPPTNRVINVMNKEGHTPIFRAVDADNADTIKWLLEHGADANLGEELPLERAFILNYTKCAEALCAGGANVNAINRDGVTLLTKAIDRDKKETIKFLLDHKADPNAKDKHNRTAIHMAASKGNQAVMETLLALKGDINIADDEGRTPLDYAGDSNAAWVEWLKSKGAKPGQTKPKPAETAEEDDGNTALHNAVYGNNLAALKNTLKATPNLVNQKNKYGDTPLMTAVNVGWPEGVEALLAAGGNLRDTDTYGLTLLHKAARKKSPDLARLLIEKGADINAADKRGTTPLHRAAESKTAIETLKLFLAKGANRSAKDKDGKTPLDYATKAKNTAAIELLK